MENFFELLFPTYKEIDRDSKFQYYRGHRGGSRMPGTGDAGDSSTLQTTSGHGYSKISNPLKSEQVSHTKSTVGSKYPELDNLYKLHQTIGNGGFSKVKMATELSSGKKVAIKIVDKDHVGEELPRINIEIDTLQSLNHRFICKLINVLYSEKKILMIMEYCPTDLYEYIVRQDENLTEEESRRIFIQLVSAVTYLHSIGVAHRDLKPENVLLDDDNNVKLTDFGLCAVPQKRGINKPILTTMCGSPAYCAPELLHNPPYIGSKADVWSLGVILFVLLTSQLPFYSKNLRDLYKKIQEVQYVIPDWLSRGAIDLIDKMLQANPMVRPSLNALWSHPWIQAGDLHGFQDQTDLINEEIRLEMENGFGDERFGHTDVVGYMMDVNSRASISRKIPFLEEQEQLVDEATEKQKNCLTWISRGFEWFRKGISKMRNSLNMNKKEAGIEDEPEEIELTTLLANKAMTGLTCVDEEFADCILDKLQVELQSIGIPSKRKGTMVKDGVASPCKYKFEVVSLGPLDLLFVRRKYIRSKDPKIICNIMQKVLLISKSPSP